jgi:hypothetical protein
LRDILMNLFAVSVGIAFVALLLYTKKTALCFIR